MEQRILDDFEILERIYARTNDVEVSKARLKSTGEYFCLKKIRIDNIDEANRMYSEILNPSSLHHDNVVKVKGCILHGNNGRLESLIIIMDYYPEGDLENYIISLQQGDCCLLDEDIIEYALQLINALRVMQLKEICHRDIKAKNIMVHSHARILILTDFGNSRFIRDVYDFSVAGTPFYMSPEMRTAYIDYLRSGITTFRYNPYKSDVFSLGLVILYLASLEKPIDLTNLDTLQNNIQSRLDQIRTSYPLTCHLLAKMLEVDPNARPDFVELYSLIKTLLSPQKPCNHCKTKLTAITQIEYQGLFFCQKCYPVILAAQHFCELCKTKKLENEGAIDENRFYCRACLSNLQTFVIGKL